MPTQELYYSTDDGATTFTADAGNGLSFTKDGKEAVRAYLYTCDDKKTNFVAYLERDTPEARKQREALRAKATQAAESAQPGPPVDAMMYNDMMNAVEAVEVKKPGAGKWVKRFSAEGQQVTAVTCPNGGTPQDLIPDE
jgi:hypothetical protein